MSDNHTKPDLKANHGAHNRNEPHKRGLLLRFIIFMAWVAGIGLLLSLVACSQATVKPIATDTNNGYYIDLSKKHASGKPYRYSLAFFVPDNSAASQAVPIHSSIAPQAHTCATRGQTIISKVTTSPTDYDGLTLQNKTAERRICGAVACVTESKTRHPILLPYSVAHTQKTTQGGHHNA
ncbi:MAG: hypothetical protein OSA85_08530 [Psychrobacter pacificensis]|uniref:hypothetical protein n=1 Tax=Psychrobacter pacificensis TaxID=112002 RepID=UPI0023A379A6|nr:hypothetical protein [Psychrobacter pacificensis]MDE0844087.1 hypothetical protein [Psychrobacter pacificensis]